jgi:hypothetical protein
MARTVSLSIVISSSQRSHTDTGAESAEQTRVAGRAIAEVVLPFLVLDIGSLRVLLGHCGTMRESIDQVIDYKLNRI